MARRVHPDLYPDIHPSGVVQLIAPLLRWLKVLVYLTLALLIVAVLDSFLPIGTWLLLCAGLAAPTLASAMLVAGD